MDDAKTVSRLGVEFDGLSAADKREFRRLQSQIDGEGEGAAPSGRSDLVATLPEDLARAVTAAMTTDGPDRLEAARVLSAADVWLRASAAERAIAAWAVSTFDGDAGGYLRPPPGLDDGLRAVLGQLDRRAGRWLDPPGALPAPVAPLEPVAVDWAAPAPPREWLVDGLLPAGRVSALYGPGESGKSRMTLQLALGVVGETDVPVVPVRPETTAPGALDIPRVRRHGPVLMVTWEDETDEIRRRAAAVQATPGGSAGDPEVLRERLRVIDMRAVGGPLWAPRADGSRHTSTEGEWTEAGRRLLETVDRDRPALIVIDPIAAAYACSEVDRGLVRRFVGAVDAVAESVGAAVLLVGHPAKGGGDGYSGSTDWRNGVRALLTLGPADTALEVDVGERRPVAARAPALQRDKSSYGPARAPLWLVSHYQAPVLSRPGQAPRDMELCWFATDETTAARAVDDRASYPDVTAAAERRAGGADTGGGGTTSPGYGRGGLPGSQHI